MLNNPDTAPSASINHWIVSILTFHFELRHVPGKIHGPDGLSRRPPQPEDLDDNEDPDTFNDWVNHLYGFLHLLNPTTPAPQTNDLLYRFATEQSPIPESDPDLDNAQDTTYAGPRSNSARLVDQCLRQAHDWLTSLE